jgi:ATP-dependent Clp protease ATP-binding subunit ClpA
MANKMERFTQRARRVLSLAQEEATRLKHNAIGTEHILIGLMRTDGGIAERVLKNVGLEIPQVKSTVEHLTSDYTRTPGAQGDLTDEAKKVVELSIEAARKLGHPYVGTEHLLLGLIQCQEGLALEILKRLNVNPDEIVKQTNNLLQELPPPPVGELASKEDVTEPSLTKLLKLSDPVRKVLIYAADEARKAKSDAIETEHLLLGLMREHEQFINMAVMFLKITPDELRKLISENGSKQRVPGE